MPDIFCVGVGSVVFGDIPSWLFCRCLDMLVPAIVSPDDAGDPCTSSLFVLSVWSPSIMFFLLVGVYGFGGGDTGVLSVPVVTVDFAGVVGDWYSVSLSWLSSVVLSAESF